MALRIDSHNRRRSPALHRNAVEGLALSLNTNGGVETFSATNSLNHIIVDSAIPSYTGVPTTQSPTPTPTLRITPSISPQLSIDSLTFSSKFSTVTDSSSVTSPSSSPVPVQSAPSGSWVSTHKLILAGAIAGFTALALAISFVVIIGYRRARTRRLEEELSRKSFAAGQISMIEWPSSKRDTIAPSGSTRHWRGLGSKDDIAADFRGNDPVSIPLGEYVYPQGEKLSRSRSMAPSLPPQDHEPFRLTGAFGPSPTNDEDDRLMHPTTPSPQPLAKLRTLTPYKSGRPELYTRQEAPPYSPSAYSSHYTVHSDPEILPPSPPLPVAETGKAAKAARTTNIRALENLIAALDDGSDAGNLTATRLPEPSVWRAALGGSPTSSTTPSNRHAKHDARYQSSSHRVVR